MPRGDRTGPMGQGPRTGRGMGFCNGFNMPGYANPGFGRGFGRGFGFRRAGFAPVIPVEPMQPTKEDEKKILKEEITIIEQEKKALDQEVQEIKKRLAELK